MSAAGEIDINSAEALANAKEFESAGDAFKDAGVEMQASVDVFSSFKGALADAMHHSFDAAITAQDMTSSDHYSYGWTMTNAESTFVTADEDAASKMQ